MKFLFLNAVTRSGNRKSDGKRFEFTQVNVAVPMENTSSENYSQHGFGWDTEAFDLDPSALPLFKSVKLGQEVDLAFEPQQNNPRRNWVVGVKV